MSFFDEIMSERTGVARDTQTGFADELLGVQAVDQPPEQPGFAERVSDRIGERQREFQDIIEARLRPEDPLGVAETATQVVGKGIAGPVLDVMAEGMTSIGRGIADFTPEFIKGPLVEGATSAWNTLSGSEAGQAGIQAILGGADAWNEFKQANPDRARTVESVVNTAALLAPVKVKAKAEPSVLGKAATALEKKAAAQVAKSRTSYLTDLVTPERTKKVLLEEVPRTTEIGVGPFRRNIVEPTQREKDIIKEVGKIKAIKPGMTKQRSYSTIAEANKKLAIGLENALGKNKAVIDQNNVSTRLFAAIDDVVKNNPTVVGDRALESRAMLVHKKATDLLDQHGYTPVGLLKARRDLDRWLLDNRKNVFDASENTLSASGRAIRTEINNILDETVKNVAVKRSLNRQSLLYDAMENIGPKAAAEGNYAVTRAWDNMTRLLPTRNQLIQEAAMFGMVGGLGAAAIFAPAVSMGIGAVIGTTAAGRAIVHPAGKKMLALTVKGLDQAILSSKNPSMIRQLRADRAIIMDLLDNAVVREPEQTTPIGEQE